jgi:hypothetical protein
MVQPPLSGQPPGAIPGVLLIGTTGAARGLALIGEEGSELIRSISGKLMLGYPADAIELGGGKGFQRSPDQGDAA